MSRTSPVNKKKISTLAWVIQALFLLGIVALLSLLVSFTLENLRSRGIVSGFGFLQRAAGFDLSFHLLPYDEEASFAWMFLLGLLNTLLVSSLAIVLSFALGLPLGLMRMAQHPILRAIAGLWMESLRNIPLLLQLFFWYFAVLRNLPGPRDSLSLASLAFLNNRGLSIPFPSDTMAAWGLFFSFLLGLILGHFLHDKAKRERRKNASYPWYRFPSFILPLLLPVFYASIWGQQWTISWPSLQGFNFIGGLQILPEFVALVLALSFYTSTFIAEIIRAGLQAVAKGQNEAAQSLGLGAWHRFQLIIMPQAIRVILPPLTSQFLNVTKNSSLAAAIAFPDLVQVMSGTALNITGQALEIMLLTLMVYLFLSLLTSWLMNRYEDRHTLRSGGAV